LNLTSNRTQTAALQNVMERRLNYLIAAE